MHNLGAVAFMQMGALDVHNTTQASLAQLGNGEVGSKKPR